MMPLKANSDIWFDPLLRWQLASSWIEDCFHAHQECERRGRPFLPSRCLDIGTQSGDTIRLLTPKSELGRYSCLSHCWGLNNTCKLTSETFARYTNGVPLEELPRTYRDAIAVCRFLGLKYIWIDSLCILQDSKADWLAESPKMIKYYGQCYVCIAATNVSGPDSGLEIAERPSAIRASGVDQDDIPYSLLAYPRDLVSSIPHFSRADKATVQNNFPLMSRGWVLQERWLAPRTLHFCGKEVVFECTEGLKCECGHANDTFLLRGDEGRLMSIENMRDGVVLRRKREDQLRWTEFVSAYTTLNLTFATDHLPAISGLARHFLERRGDNHPGQYLAGLWRNSLHEELVWFRGEPLLQYRDRPQSNDDEKSAATLLSPVDQKSKIEKYIAPSWSWASILDAVTYRSPGDGRTALCEVLETHIALDGTDEFGSVAKGCSLKVQGRLSRSAWSLFREGDLTEYMLSDITGTQRMDRYEARGINFLPDYAIEDADNHETTKQEELFVLPIISQGVTLSQWAYNPNDREAVMKELEFAKRVRNKMCLVLRKLPLQEESIPSYERVGFTEFANVSANAENEDTNQYVDETLLIL